MNKYYKLCLLFVGILSVLSCGESGAEPMDSNVDVAFYISRDWGCGSITVGIPQGQRTLTSFISGPFNCESAIEGVFNSLEPGTYEFQAVSESGCLWSNSFTVVAGAGCQSYELSEADFQGNICDIANWSLNEDCIVQVAQEELAEGCGVLGNSPLPTLTLVNSCTQDLVIYACTSSSFRGIGSITPVMPNDTLRLENCGGFDGLSIYSFNATTFARYTCPELECM